MLTKEGNQAEKRYQRAACSIFDVFVNNRESFSIRVSFLRRSSAPAIQTITTTRRQHSTFRAELATEIRCNVTCYHKWQVVHSHICEHGSLSCKAWSRGMWHIKHPYFGAPQHQHRGRVDTDGSFPGVFETQQKERNDAHTCLWEVWEEWRGIKHSFVSVPRLRILQVLGFTRFEIQEQYELWALSFFQ